MYIYIGIDVGRLNITAFPLSPPNENNIILWFVCRFSFSHFGLSRLDEKESMVRLKERRTSTNLLHGMNTCNFKWILHRVVSYHTGAMRRICLRFGMVERWTLCFAMTLCLTLFSGNSMYYVLFFSSYTNIGTVRLLGMHLWLFFWIVLFCWIIVCTLYFSVFFRFSWKPCCFNIVSILRSQLPGE